MSQAGLRFFECIRERLAAETGSTMQGRIAMRITWPEGEELFTMEFSGTNVTHERRVRSPDVATLHVWGKFIRMILAEQEVDMRSSKLVTKIDIHDPRRQRLVYFLGHLCNAVTPVRREIVAAAERRYAESSPVTTIERLPWDSDTLKEHVDRSRPVILTGAVSHWPALRWNAEYLVKNHGDTLIGAVPCRRLFGNDTSTTVYIPGVPVPDALADAFGDLPVPWGRLRLLRLFAGQKGGVNHLHRDFVNACLVHIFGRKDFVLYPPDAGESVYAMKNYGKFQPCWVDAYAPDTTLHPRMSEVKPLRTSLEPGEFLLLPVGWYHAVFAEDPTMSLTTFVVPDGEEPPSGVYE
jgi:hypothetical protein